MKLKYQVVIDYSKEDGGYMATVPALKYCTAFGKTYEEAAREITVAIKGWLEVAKKNGIRVAPKTDIRATILRAL